MAHFLRKPKAYWPNRLLRKDDASSWGDHRAYLRDINGFLRSVEQLGAPPVESEGTFQALVLNYKRPWNIALLARVLLHVSEIQKVTILNNNPSCDLNKWGLFDHPRLELITSPEEKGVSERQMFLRGSTFEHFLCLDDDVLALPSQLSQLCQEFFKKSTVPHGIAGQIHRGDGWRFDVRGETTEVDVLNRVYAFSKQHLERWHELLPLLTSRTSQEVSRESYWDDMLLSFCGEGRPWVHDVGPFLDCATSGNSTIAVWKRNKFFERREGAWEMLSRHRNMQNRTLKASVVMSVYNGLPDVKPALESLLNQSCQDIEILVVDDASTDGTHEALQEYAKRDERILLLKNHKNLGQTASAARAISVASGAYIARLDADDIAAPNRIQKQLEYLEAHPRCSLVSTQFSWVNITPSADKKVAESGLSTKPHVLEWLHLFYNVFACQSAVMFCKSAYNQAGGYRPRFCSTEDYDLWLRLFEHGEPGVVDESLVEFRRGRQGSVSMTKNQVQQTLAFLLSQAAILQLTGESISKQMHDYLVAFWKPQWSTAVPDEALHAEAALLLQKLFSNFADKNELTKEQRFDIRDCIAQQRAVWQKATLQPAKA